MTTHEVLVAARNLLNRRGWLQYSLGSPVHGHCALGAIDHSRGDAGYSRPDWGEWSEAAAAALVRAGNLPGDPGGSTPSRSPVVDFNNADGRTKEEVLALFDKAIAQTAPEPDVLFVKDEEPVCVA